MTRLLPQTLTLCLGVALLAIAPVRASDVDPLFEDGVVPILAVHPFAPSERGNLYLDDRGRARLAAPVVHAGNDTLALRPEDTSTDRAIVYSADTEPCPSLIQLRERPWSRRWESPFTAASIPSAGWWWKRGTSWRGRRSAAKSWSFPPAKARPSALTPCTG